MESLRAASKGDFEMRFFKVMALSAFFCLFTAGYAFSACTVSISSTSPVNFGNYDVLSAIPNDANGNIAVTVVGCAPGGPPGPPGESVDVTVVIEASPTPPGGFNPRWLQHPAFGDLLQYNVFIDAGRTVIWGDTASGGTGKTVNNLFNETRNFPVYGRIPALQNVSGGAYTENLVVKVYQKGTFNVLASSSLTITTAVIPSCSVTGTTAVAFGVYDTLSAVDNTSGAGNFTFQCGVATAYELYVGGVRQMNDGLGNLINYEIYTDAGRTSVWPSSTPSTETGTTGVAPITRDVFGRIFAGQDVPIGVYSSTVTVTVIY